MDTLQSTPQTGAAPKHAGRVSLDAWLLRPSNVIMLVGVLVTASVVVAGVGFGVLGYVADSMRSQHPGWEVFLWGEGESLRHYYPVTIDSVGPVPDSVGASVMATISVKGNLGTGETFACEAYAGNPKPVYLSNAGINGDAYTYAYPVRFQDLHVQTWRMEPGQVRHVTVTLGLQSGQRPIPVTPSNTTVVCYAEHDVNGMLPQ